MTNPRGNPGLTWQPRASESIGVEETIHGQSHEPVAP